MGIVNQDHIKFQKCASRKVCKVYLNFQETYESNKGNRINQIHKEINVNVNAPTNDYLPDLTFSHHLTSLHLLLGESVEKRRRMKQNPS